MRIGLLRQRVMIQKEQQTPDNAGGYVLSWVNVTAAWADIAPSSGQEKVASSGLQSRVTHKMTLRWRRDIALTPAMRLVYKNRFMNIHSVINYDETNHWAALLVEEGGAI